MTGLTAGYRRIYQDHVGGSWTVRLFKICWGVAGLRRKFGVRTITQLGAAGLRVFIEEQLD